MMSGFSQLCVHITTRTSISIISNYSCTIFFFNDTATTEIFTLSLHDALPIYARYGFRCCHLKNIWTAPLPPETELSRQMTTSTTSIDIMGLQAAYANLHTDQERDYFMQRYHDVISSFGGK